MARKDFLSPRKNAFLSSLPKDSISTSDITTRCKFNFSYLDISQEWSSDFIDLNTCSGQSKLLKLIDKIKEFSRQPLNHWEKQPIGKGKQGGKGKRQSCLEIYGDFPQNSGFSHPPHVPDDVLWGRFRIDNETRLAGFIIPKEFDGKLSEHGIVYDLNTFYVVFLDENHKFYQI